MYFAKQNKVVFCFNNCYTIRMKVLNPTHQIEFNKKYIFLCGTMADVNEQDWREFVIGKLRESGFDGVVYNPDYTNIPQNKRLSYEDQILWEIAAMKSSAIVCFWINRKMDSHPGLTTNVEFGYWVRSSKVVYGRPQNAEKCFYLDYIYALEQNKQPVDTLEGLASEVIKLTKEAK